MEVLPVDQQCLSAYISRHRIMARQCRITLRLMTAHDQAVHVHEAHAATGEALPRRKTCRHGCHPLEIYLGGAAGRPVDVEVSSMGLLISDDYGGAVYRVAYNASFEAAVATFAPTQVKPYEAGPP